MWTPLGLDASTNPHISMDVNLLLLSKESASASSSDEKEAEDASVSTPVDESCYFDESVTIDSVLGPTDILIISPLRSMHARYTPMVISEGHQLYLGPIPTVEFLTQCKVGYLMNCCMKPNEAEIREKTNVVERVFNVGRWGKKKHVFQPVEMGNDSFGKDYKNKMGPMAYLDAMIDEMHHYLQRGNILVHCLAGAHRSPFITGCYLMKYGMKGTKVGESAENIYVFMKGKRSIVQELGFDKRLQKYQKYLVKQQKLADEQ